MGAGAVVVVVVLAAVGATVVGAAVVIGTAVVASDVAGAPTVASGGLVAVPDDAHAPVALSTAAKSNARAARRGAVETQSVVMCSEGDDTARTPRRVMRSTGEPTAHRVETMGLEPTTPCLQSRCSSQLSYVPAGRGQG